MRYSSGAILFLTVLVLSSALFFFRLGDRGFRNPDEGRYAEISREMVVNNNWIEPKIYGVDYLKKPALFYWLTAFSLKIFGFNEWAGRSVPALFGLLGVLATFWFVQKIFGERSAFFSSFVLASNFWYLEVGRYLVIDAVFSFFVMSGLYCFYLARHSPKDKLRYYLLFYICVSLAVLAKGVLGALLPSIPIILYLWLTKELGAALKEMHLGLGAALFLLIAVPWFVLISLKEPEFLRIFFLHENFSRFASVNFEHQEPWYFYIVLMPVILMPWPLFWRPLAQSWAASNKMDPQKDQKNYFLLTSLSMVLFFTLSKAKLLTYILPSVPFFSILIGHAWSLWQNDIHQKKAEFDWAEYAPVFLLIFLGLATMIATPKVIARFGQELPDGVGNYIQWMGAALFAGGLAALTALRRRNIAHLFYSLVFTMVLLSLSFTFAMEKMNGDYTNKHFALTLKPRLRLGDRVFIYDHPGALYDFGFYLDYPVTLVGLEGELEFSRHDPENEKASVTHQQFKKMLENKERIYCLARKSDYLEMEQNLRKNLVVLQEDKRKVLFST